MKGEQKYFTLINLISQLKDDLFGKDSYRGFSLTYSWLANQFGHFSLGFIPTYILCSVLTHCKHNCPNIKALLIIGLLWTIFEIFNLFYPILKGRIYFTTLPFLEKGAKREFDPKWSSLILDNFTDICYFWFGGMTCYLFINKLNHDSNLNLFSKGAECYSDIYISYSFYIIVAILIFLSYYWYNLRMNLQNASLPMQFRLSQWSGDISKDDKKTIETYLSNSKGSKHLIIFGYNFTNKSDLSIAIGNELAFKFHKLYYSSFVKFLEKMHDRNRSISKFWNIEDVEYLIIDQLNVGRPYFKDFISAKRFFSIVNASNDFEFLRKKKIIWTIGIKNDDDKEMWIENISKFFGTMAIDYVLLEPMVSGSK